MVDCRFCNTLAYKKAFIFSALSIRNDDDCSLKFSPFQVIAISIECLDYYLVPGKNT